jgi:branched-subunit amino acid ABC-type transport system permease component
MNSERSSLAQATTAENRALSGERRIPFFLLGVLLVALGLAGVALELLVLKHLAVPWYAPLMATAGVASMLIAVKRRPTAARIIGLGFFCLFCVAEWWFLTWAIRLPAYTGPAHISKPFPAFAATLADGQSLTERDLRGGTPSVVVFFRGRW